MPSPTHPALSFGRTAAMAVVALLLLAGGVWASWSTAQHVMLPKGREHGTLSVASCRDEICTGPYDPKGPGGPRAGMFIAESVAVKRGDTFPVVVKPDTNEVVRTGTAGVLYAWVPLGGTFLLGALVVGGGMRLTRTAWGLAAAGSALLFGAFLAL
ncbi:hypothetical protein [Streptomyces sp. NPDC088725]|uniref:hypothetical protein n=1 Tax=Streptomyces sp. NPDC088725 TaxID=3365873 RepID=UPI003812C285